MKILVLSDSHGNIRGVEKALKQFGSNADVVVHCGDGTRGEAEWLKENCARAKVVCVRGNCDFGGMLRDNEYFEACGRKIMVTHGHLYNVKFGLAQLSYKAEEEGCDIVFFGHTHCAADETLGNTRMINPGSCGRWEPVCAVVELDDKGNVLVNHVRIK